MRVGVFDFEDPEFISSLSERGASVERAAASQLDLAFLMVREPADLRRLADLRPLIRSNGAIWVLRSKGAAATVRELDVIEAGQEHLLVDNKIASFSDALAAMRLVIPLGLR
jgi:3-hydroxyisobutyrate dehydrogenase-like beta-hydroxyacid dehydrogenase